MQILYNDSSITNSVTDGVSNVFVTQFGNDHTLVEADDVRHSIVEIGSNSMQVSSAGKRLRAGVLCDVPLYPSITIIRLNQKQD